MPTKSLPQVPQMPNYPVRFILGLCVLVLTLLLIITAVGFKLDDGLVDERCETAPAQTAETVSAETAVPDCWLTQ